MISAKKVLSLQLKKVEKDILEDIKLNISANQREADWGCSDKRLMQDVEKTIVPKLKKLGYTLTAKVITSEEYSDYYKIKISW